MKILSEFKKNHKHIFNKVVFKSLIIFSILKILLIKKLKKMVFINVYDIIFDCNKLYIEVNLLMKNY